MSRNASPMKSQYTLTELVLADNQLDTKVGGANARKLNFNGPEEEKGGKLDVPLHGSIQQELIRCFLS